MPSFNTALPTIKIVNDQGKAYYQLNNFLLVYFRSIAIILHRCIFSNSFSTLIIPVYRNDDKSIDFYQ